MIKLFVQQSDNKFINNILLSKYDNIELYSASIDNNLYELFYNINFDACIFMGSSMNPEMYQFIKEFANTDIQIYLYHNNTADCGLIDLQFKSMTHLVEPYIVNKQSRKIKPLPALINKDVFYDRNFPKIESIACFLDSVNEIPVNLLNQLYPNTALPIKLFNNANIKHHQNLGLLTERDKSVILNQYQYYLSIDNHYAAEAAACRCLVLDICELKDMRPVRYKHVKKAQTYSTYIENLLCKKI